jgi:hypothetical protein
MSTKVSGGVTAKNTRVIPATAPAPVHGAVAEKSVSCDNGRPPRKIPGKAKVKREQNLLKDSVFTIRRDAIYHIISENYAYKTETYYTILRQELEGKTVRPSSSAILDAYVVPICLERAKLGGIPVCEWGISPGYVPLPSILYGLNYFATPSDFFVVHDNDKAKEVIKHITNNGKYPFCYQKLDDEVTVHSSIGIFGKADRPGSAIARLAEMVYECFPIPLVTMVFVKNGEEYLLSSLAPARYSQLTIGEHKLLAAYLSHQEFL